MEKIFLTAEWKHIVMLNYAVERSLLDPYVPSGTVLDFFEGRTYLSLIGFLFNRSRVLGLSIPFHQSFEEINIRFYVNREGKRGAVFIRELVPKRAVAVIARTVFNESYSCVPMSHQLKLGPGGEVYEAEYTWGRGLAQCAIRMEVEGDSFVAPEGSLSQFITEHYWGYAKQRDGGCLEYEVEHPRWAVWNAKNASFTGNSVRVYGEKIAQVLARDPDSAFLANGSAVAVSHGVRIG